MSTVTENDLKALKDFIGEQFQEVNSKIDRLSGEINGLKEEVNGLKVEIAIVKGEIGIVKGDVKSIDSRLGKLEDTKEKQIWTLIMLLGGAVLTFSAKLFLMGNNP